ncbi:MAG: fibronectin type III domain-containing protein [Oscillospiraceae bacterium]|nr:fibronectin type III domain-containing protein [Oscillospiraceae bacterium]
MKKSKIIAAAFAFILAGTAISVPGSVAEEYSVSARSTLAAPKNVKASPDTNYVTISWSKVDDADAYRVYKYDSRKKKYVKIKTVSGTKTKIAGLEPGTSYSFKVASLAEDGNTYVAGGVSGKVTVTTKGTAKKTKTTAKKPTTKKKNNKKIKLDASGHPYMPVFANAGFYGTAHATSFICTGRDTSETERNILDQFAKYRFKVVSAGYDVKLVNHKADVGTYIAEYELSYEGEHVYTLYEHYRAFNTSGTGYIEFYPAGDATAPIYFVK